MSLLRWIIGVPFVLGAIAFALANDEIILFSWSPIHEPVEAPVYALVIAALAFGFIFGSLMTWASGHGARREKRLQAKTIKKLEADLAKCQQDVKVNETMTIVQRPLESDLYS